MTWALKRQISYTLLVIIFILVLASLVLYPRFNKAPSCFDYKQNGDETGVDCGGSCASACTFQVDQVSILWSRSFKVVDGRYNAVAYLENHNNNVAINKIKYKFRFADKDNIYIGKREGEISVPPSGHFAVFEPAIDVGNSIPVYTSFEFTEVPKWTQVDPIKVSQLKVLVSNIELSPDESRPALSAVIKNDSLFIIPELNVVVILYDKSGNAISASRTYLDKLGGGEIRDVNFTWPEPLGGVVVAKEIIPMYNIFSVRLK